MDKPNVPLEVRQYADKDPEPSLFLASRDKPNSFERHVQHFMEKLKPPSFLAAVFPPPPMLPSLQKTFMSFKPNESVYAAGNVNTHVQEGGTMYFQVPGEGAVELSTCKGNKKALLIGINYKNSKSPLSGCISDVQNIRKLIQKFYGFTDSNIVQLTDDSKDPNYYPTKENIFNSIRWLVDGSKPGDSLFFHFSGHGGISAHQDKADFSGKDETIFPVDYTTEGIITDVELHHLMVYTLPTGVRLTAIFDCCHSGTVLDLPYIYKCSGDIEVHTDADHHEAAKKLFEAGVEFQKGDKEDGFAMMKASMEVFKAHAKNDLIRKKWKQDHTTLADVVQFAGCKDDQTSADVRKHVGDTVIASGAMSYALIQILEKNPHPQYKDLLYHLRDILGQKKYTQVPQLCTGRPMDLTQEFSIPWLLPRVLLFSTLSVNPNTGLDEQEAQKRLVRYGPNSLPNSSPSLRSTLSSHELLGTSTASYLLVLILYALNGVNYILLISLVAILIFSRAYFRYGARSRENLALQDPPPDVLVRRDGQDLLIPADRIVPGDIFYLCPYQRVPCDAAVLISHGLVVDEQLITGRLNFAEKIALTIATVLDPVENIRPPHVAPFVVERGESSNKQTTENEDLNRRVPSTYVCAGSLTIQGTAMCLATQTGLNCLLNDEWAFKLPQETRTPLQKKLRQFLRFWNTGLLCFCLLLGCFTSWSASLLLFLVLNFKDANDVLKTILTSGVDLLRQEGIYIRRLRALELLADVSTVVTTGSAAVTLDAYNLEAAMVINMDQKCKMQRCISVGPKDVVGSKVQLEQLLIPAVLSCDPSFQFTQSLETYDSHEYHILQYASSSQPTLLTDLNETYPALVGEARFNSSTKLSSRAWRASPNSGPVLVAVKGAPEVVLDRCTRICIPSLGESVDSARDIVEITPDVRRLVDEYISSWAREGYQVFAFAYTMVGAPDEMAEAMDKLIFAGCFVFSKVVLPYARYFAEELQSAQVKVILSSGDHQLTAQHIGEVISADQTYYRCTPDFKYQLVKSLKSQGAETVMFLGDPGHDISALYFADIGIVWRHTGRCIDIACESASVFFYARNDGLGDVCYFICEGRQILRNLQVGLSVFFAGKLLLAAVLVYASHDPNTLYLHVLYGEFLVVWAAQTLFTNQDRHIIGFVEPFKIPFRAASIWKIFSRDILINAATILVNLAINRNHHQFLALQCALGATLIHRLRYKWTRAWALWCLLLLVYLVAFAGLENHWEEDLGYVVLSNLSIIAISWFAHMLFQEDEANSNNANPGYM